MSDSVAQGLLQLVAAQKRTFENPISNITPALMAQQMTAFRAGSLREFAQLCEAIETGDDLLAGLIPKAKAAVARHGFEVGVVGRIRDDQKELAERQKTVLEHFYNNIRATSASEPDELGGFGLLVRQIMDAKAKRYSVHHIVWRYDGVGAEGVGLYTATMVHVPLWFFENRSGPLRFIRQPYGYDGEPLDPGAWLVSVGAGLMRACAAAWMFKRKPLHAWVGYCEKFGWPGVLGKTDAAPGTPDWDAMVKAVASFSEDWSGVINKSAELAFMEVKGSGTLPHPALVERMDRAMSALWRGADLSTMSAGSGAGDGASLQGEESDIVEQDDAAWVSETLQLKVDRLVIDYVFGVGTPQLAFVKVKTAAKQNVERDLKIDQMLLGAGHPISQSQIAERYDRPVPAANELLLRAPAVPLQLGNGSQVAAINERQGPAAVRATLFRDSAISTITAAQRVALRPLLTRLADVSDLPDDKFEAGMAQLRKDLPGIAKKILSADSTGALAKAWQSVLGTAMASGAAEAAQRTSSK